MQSRETPPKINADVYVLSEGHRALYNILPKSAVVSTATLRHNHVLQIVYFEGNMYGTVNLVRFIERVNCAWGRMAYRYPTGAMMAVARDHLIKVGEFDCTALTMCVENAAALTAWLGVDEIDPRELTL